MGQKCKVYDNHTQHCIKIIHFMGVLSFPTQRQIKVTSQKQEMGIRTPFAVPIGYPDNLF